MLEFQQNEKTAERRRWIIVLVDSADGVTGKTGQSGTVKVSKNGGEPEDSTNQIVEVDAVEMPGHYYIELSEAELNTLGFVSIYYKAANTLAFHDRALVSYNDPYVMNTGGIFSSEGGPVKITKKQLDYIADRVWKYAEENGQNVFELLKQAAQHPTIDLAPLQEKIDGLEFPTVDLQPVLDRIEDIKFPEIYDYRTELAGISDQIAEIDNKSFKELNTAINAFQKKMDLATTDINASLETVQKIKSGFVELKEAVDKFNESVAAATDMDKRFENMAQAMQSKELVQLSSDVKAAMQKILTAVTDSKYDIIAELTPESK